MRSEKLFLWQHNRNIHCFLLGWIACWIFAPSLLAEKITIERIAELSSIERPVWEDYLNRSDALRKRIESQFESQLKDSGSLTSKLAPEGDSFRLPSDKQDSWYLESQANELADVLVSFQNPAGGWTKHLSVSEGLRGPGVHWSSQGTIERPRYVGTFDNGSTTTQILFLARMHRVANRQDCKLAVEKGLEFILAAQYPNGGWPQVFPLEGGYHDDITFNDDAMVHVLEVLDKVRRRHGDFEFIPEVFRERCSESFERGIHCILATQQKSGNRPSVWCAQHDALTLKPSKARAMEPASLSGSESVGVLKLLMSIEKPTPSIIDAIEGGLEWFEKHRIQGPRPSKTPSKTSSNENLVSQDSDPSNDKSNEVYWARFYDLETNKPVYPGRDGIVYDSFAEMAKNNRLGYDYTTTKPLSLLGSGQKKWRKQLQPIR
jgi:PelA/Pel-15E family pectate lyase